MKIIQDIILKKEDGELLLTDIYIPSRQSASLILFLHGYKTYKNWGAYDLMAMAFLKAGFGIVKFNFSGSGVVPEEAHKITDLEKFGNNNIERELSDIEFMKNWIQGGALEAYSDTKIRDISLVGHSRGGSLAILSGASDKSIKKIIAWAAFSDFYEMIHTYDIQTWKENGVLYSNSPLSDKALPRYYSQYEILMKDKKKYALQGLIEKSEKKILLIHGMDDEIIPYEQAMQMKKWNKAVRLSLIPGATHTFGAYHPYDQRQLPFDFAMVLKESLNFLKP
jgi:uncharacterized protein